jgi:hypothetical protein
LLCILDSSPTSRDVRKLPILLQKSIEAGRVRYAMFRQQ